MHIRIEQRDKKFFLTGFENRSYSTVIELIQKEKEKLKIPCPSLNKTQIDFFDALPGIYKEREDGLRSSVILPLDNSNVEEDLVNFLKPLYNVPHTPELVKTVIDKLKNFSKSLEENENDNNVALSFFRSRKYISHLKKYLEALLSGTVKKTDPFYLLQIGEKQPSDFEQIIK